MQIFNIVEELEKERKKNKELEELCNKYEEEHKTTFKIWQKDIQANKKAIEKLQLIIDIGFDYDGYNSPEKLKKLIDELVKYAEETKEILKGDNNE